MSGTRIMKKNREPKSKITLELSEFKSIIGSLLAPITHSLNNLNEKVAFLVNSINKRGHTEILKTSLVHDLSAGSITGDIISNETQNLSKNYSSLKKQVSTYQNNLKQIHEKLASMDKLLGSLVERGAKKGPLESSEMLQLIDEYFTSVKTAQLGANPTEQKIEGTPKTLDTKDLQVVTLNNFDDFPQGSWLGNPDSPKARVRCPIRPENLIHINYRCTTPEKMALTLLDHLFSKETLSISNISGKSKLGKKKLDPLMMYGIRCHLMHHFAITEKNWEKIKVNIDSKCRSAWRKRRTEPGYCISVETEVYAEDSQSKDYDYLPVLQENEGNRPKKRVIRTPQGDIEVFSSDQILRFGDFHNIHVLDGDNILPMAESDGEETEHEMSLNSCPEPSHLAIVPEDNRQDAVSFVMEPMLAEGSPLEIDHVLLDHDG